MTQCNGQALTATTDTSSQGTHHKVSGEPTPRVQGRNMRQPTEIWFSLKTQAVSVPLDPSGRGFPKYSSAPWHRDKLPCTPLCCPVNIWNFLPWDMKILDSPPSQHHHAAMSQEC